jgi:hypothetical protein
VLWSQHLDQPVNLAVALALAVEFKLFDMAPELRDLAVAGSSSCRVLFACAVQPQPGLRKRTCLVLLHVFFCAIDEKNIEK